MILNNIYIENQDITYSILKEALIHCYNNMCFSTYPYIQYNTLLSKDTITKYNSGNCIALTYFIKQYLKNNYGINSHQIIASVPDHFRISGQPNICHIVLFISKSEYEYYIVDPAFYFLEPIHIDIRDNREKQIETYDIHHDRLSLLCYSLKKSQYDEVLPNTYSCVCYFTEYPENKFEYIFNEILNPDETIGKTYHSLKKEPFLIKTHYENNIIKKLYHIKTENNHIVIIKNRDVVYDGQPTKCDYTKLRELYKYIDPVLKLH